MVSGDGCFCLLLFRLLLAAVRSLLLLLLLLLLANATRASQQYHMDMPMIIHQHDTLPAIPKPSLT
jgi:hypothetical protein